MTAPPSDLGYRPDHASPPGDIILEYLESLGISARELARRCGRSGKLMAEIVSGKAPVEPETAIQLQRVLGMSASIWSNLEAAYRLHLASVDERTNLAASYDWAKRFPVKELAERNHIVLQSDRSALVEELLIFFGVGSVRACEDRMADLLAADFRTSLSFASSPEALAAWLRLGEKTALDRDTPDFDRDTFVASLRELRGLTSEKLEAVLPKLAESCERAGIVFVLEKPFPKVRASGVSRWLSPRKALIQQSMRYMSDDHFWFTFFHECAHLLLHSRKTIFIDAEKGPGNATPVQEAEANAWAADFLVPEARLKGFLRGFGGEEAKLLRFASEVGVAPGIVIGQLQHRGVLRFDALNHHKVRYKWA